MQRFCDGITICWCAPRTIILFHQRRSDVGFLQYWLVTCLHRLSSQRQLHTQACHSAFHTKSLHVASEHVLLSLDAALHSSRAAIVEHSPSDSRTSTKQPSGLRFRNHSEDTTHTACPRRQIIVLFLTRPPDHRLLTEPAPDTLIKQSHTNTLILCSRADIHSPNYQHFHFTSGSKAIATARAFQPLLTSDSWQPAARSANLPRSSQSPGLHKFNCSAHLHSTLPLQTAFLLIATSPAPQQKLRSACRVASERRYLY